MARADRQPPPKAFEELVTENLDALYRTALRLAAGRNADAEDLLQDAMLRAFEHFHQLQDASAGRSWLFSILVRTNLNRVRTAARRNEWLNADLTEGAFETALSEWTPQAAPDELLQRRESSERVGRALDELHPDLRSAVLLTDVEGFSHRETARMLGIPEGTVASRLFRARMELRRTLTAGSLTLKTGDGR